jgi:glycosyltransferase involved in cell wall biosynthesis
VSIDRLDCPTVSIVTPSLNQAGFIRATIESVLAQDYPTVEYLVADGGSRDGTIDVLRGYGSRIRWFSEPDSGQSAAVNRGWSMTSGRIVGWINADDTFEPGAVRRAVEFLRDHPDVDVVYGRCDYVDARGESIAAFPTGPPDYLNLVRSAVNVIPQPATFLRRRVLDITGHLDESLHYVMDLDLWLRAGLRHRFGFLPAKLANLRLHGSAKSVAQADAFPTEVLRAYRKLFASENLPASVRAVERLAMSNVHYLLADRAFWTGRMEHARAHALRGWRLAPTNVRRQLLLAAIGWPARRALERLRGNPLTRFPYTDR